MFTEIEGEWDYAFDAVQRATEAVLPLGSRVSLVMKADIRPGFEGELDGKLERLERAVKAGADKWAHTVLGCTIYTLRKLTAVYDVQMRARCRRSVDQVRTG